MKTLKTKYGMGGVIRLVMTDDEFADEPEIILAQDVRLTRTHYPYEESLGDLQFNPIKVIPRYDGAIVFLDSADDDQLVPKGKVVAWFGPRNIESTRRDLGTDVVILQVNYVGKRMVIRNHANKPLEVTQPTID